MFNVKTMTEQLGEEEAETRFAAILLTTYGALALLLAAIGIYGVLSYHVTLRTREIAVRMALGATRGDVHRMVFEDPLTLLRYRVPIRVTGSRRWHDGRWAFDIRRCGRCVEVSKHTALWVLCS